MIEGHPLGVKPLGNAYLDPKHSRVKSMGQLGLLTDDLLVSALQELDMDSLLAVGHTCKALFAYTYFDELWKHFVFKRDPPAKWYGTWRRTALKSEKDTKIDATGKVYSDFLFRPYELSQIDYRLKINEIDSHQIQMFDEKELNLDLFNAHAFKRPFVAKLSKPIAKWSMEDLIAKFGNEIFRQEYMEWPLELYTQYMRYNGDETPLYLFDCHSNAHKELVFDTPLKQIFGKDYFTLLGDDRPDHQWLIIGPKRSGSTWHKDPNGTSAWNSIVSGHKYWIMFPPNSNPPGVWTDSDQSEVTAPVSLAEWFCSGFYDEALQTRGFCHSLTGPGECMYIPSGWWHAVVNLDECIAMTGNFVPDPQLQTVLNFLQKKTDQISGFRNPEGLYEKFKALLGNKTSYLHENDTKKRKVDLNSSDIPFTFSFYES